MQFPAGGFANGIADRYGLGCLEFTYLWSDPLVVGGDGACRLASHATANRPRLLSLHYWVQSMFVRYVGGPASRGHATTRVNLGDDVYALRLQRLRAREDVAFRRSAWLVPRMKETNHFRPISPRIRCESCRTTSSPRQRFDYNSDAWTMTYCSPNVSWRPHVKLYAWHGVMSNIACVIGTRPQGTAVRQCHRSSASRIDMAYEILKCKDGHVL